MDSGKRSRAGDPTFFLADEMVGPGIMGAHHSTLLEQNLNIRQEGPVGTDELSRMYRTGKNICGKARQMSHEHLVIQKNIIDRYCW